MCSYMPRNVSGLQLFFDSGPEALSAEISVFYWSHQSIYFWSHQSIYFQSEIPVSLRTLLILLQSFEKFSFHRCGLFSALST